MSNSIFLKKDGTVKQPWAVIVLYFNKKLKPLYHPDQGRDMLLIAVVFEILRITITLYKGNLGYNDLLTTGLIAMIFLGLLIAVTKYIFRINLRDIGLKPLSQWNGYEVIYLLVIAPAGFCIFWYFNRERFSASFQENGSLYFLISFMFYMCWGFYQECLYRGFLQTELTRRHGAAAGILFANLIFTFGPLHLYQLYQGKYILIAATFLIGIIFGIIYQRSYNTWIVGILHGIGNWFLAGL